MQTLVRGRLIVELYARVDTWNDRARNEEDLLRCEHAHGTRP